MILADWIFLGGLLICIALGALIGFGKSMKFITGGIAGIIISVLLCYMFGGLILGIPFVNQMLIKLADNWAHIGWLTKLHPEIIIYYIALFAISMILRIVIMKIFAHVMETDILLIKIINKVGGAVLVTTLAILLLLFVFQIIVWIGGNTVENFSSALTDSTIVKPIFENNPLAILVEMVKPK